MKKIILLIILLILPTLTLGAETLAFVLRDIESGKVVESQNQKEQMILASVSKLFTSYYVLKNMDMNFSFETKVLFDGKNLYLKGSGDPYLTAHDLVSLIYQLKRENITEIKGDFILDDKDLSFTSRISDLGLRDQPDNPSIGALNVEFNRLSLYRGSSEFFPPLSNIHLSLEKKSNLGQRFELKSKEKKSWIGFKKEMKKKREEIPALDSTLFTGYYFRYLAKVNGLLLPEPKRGKVAPKAKEIASHRGLPLWRLVSLGLEYSNNLIAETLLKTAVLKTTNKKLSEEESAQVLMKWINTNISSDHKKEYILENGSGITLNNKSSALFMTDFLREVYKKNDLKKPFLSYLSMNGHSGGLQKMLQKPDLAFRVFGKTGSLHYVNNLAGFILGKSGKVYSYALFITDQRREKLTNDLNKTQLKLRKNAKSWYRSSNRTLESILLKWMKKY